MPESYYRLPDDIDQDIDSYTQDVRRFLAGELDAGIFKARRVARGIYEQRRDGTFMVRVRAAGGQLTARQVGTLADLSGEFSDGRLHVTTRQDVQLHNVKIEATPELMRRLRAVELSSKGGGGNTVRNIMASPFAGICPAEAFDVAPFAHAVTEYLISLTGSYNLPRKYKIAFAGSAAERHGVLANDLGFVATVRDGRPGFHVYAGGGMGAKSRLGDILLEWAEAADVVRIAEAIRRLFDRFGDRRNRHRARLRFVYERLGADAVREHARQFLAEVAADDVPLVNVCPALNPEIGERAALSQTAPSVAGDLAFWRQRQDGLLAVHVPLPLGFISADEFRVLADAAAEFSTEQGVRTTSSQDVIIAGVAESRLRELRQCLGDLVAPGGVPAALGRFVACAGASTCRLGLCLARGAAQACAEALDEAQLETDVLAALRFRISGCPNACGQHPLGPVGLFGAAKREQGRLMPAYRVVLRADRDDQPAALAATVGIVPARALPAFIVTLAQEFAAGRADCETLARYIGRRGLSAFKALVDRYSTVPAYEERPDFYRDWGRDDDFSLAGRGAGECGAGVFEVIRADIEMARQALAAPSAAPPLEALVATTRALLVTRGVDTREPAAVLSEFTRHFIQTGLVGAEHSDLIARARLHVAGTAELIPADAAQVSALLARVERLFSTLDSNLRFHPPAAEGQPAVAAPPSEPEAEKVPTLDLTGVACPMNFVKAKLRLEMMEAEATLAILLDDGEPMDNVPDSLADEGHEIVRRRQLPDTRWELVVKKKSD